MYYGNSFVALALCIRELPCCWRTCAGADNILYLSGYELVWTRRKKTGKKHKTWDGDGKKCPIELESLKVTGSSDQYANLP